MNILIPMAGAGTRLSHLYNLPKPLIDLNGKTMIERVVDNIRLDGQYIFVVQREHYEKYNLESLLKGIKPDCHIIQTEGLTEGGACTTLLAKQFIDSHPLLIANSDAILEWNPSEFLKVYPYDGIVVTFRCENERYGYVKCDEFITELAEKHRISNQASCLHYNTTIFTDKGPIQLGELVAQKKRCKVRSFNEKTKLFEWKNITNWIKKKEDYNNWYNITFSEATKNARNTKKNIFITGDHEVLTKEYGWASINFLQDKNCKILTNIELIENNYKQQILDGTLLGDGSYVKSIQGRLSKLRLKHSLVQKDWASFKAKSIYNTYSTYIYKPSNKIRIFNGRQIKDNGSIVHQFASNPYWSKQRDRWYPNGKKIIPRDINITPLLLATWYLDDGSLHGNSACFMTHSFSKEEVIFLGEKIKEKYNTNYYLWKIKNKEQYILVLSSKNHIWDIIAPYIIPSMQYKLPKKYRNLFDSDLWKKMPKEYFYSTLEIKKIDNKTMKNKKCSKHSYCITVEDNHNFVVNDMIVHNCGVNLWSNGQDYIRYAEQMIQKNIRKNNEFYVSLVHNEAIADGKKFITYNLEKMWDLGTPEDLEKFLKEHE